MKNSFVHELFIVMVRTAAFLLAVLVDIIMRFLPLCIFRRTTVYFSPHSFITPFI